MNSSSAVLNCQPPISHHHHGRRPHHPGLVEFSYMDRRRLNPREFPGLCSRSSLGNCIPPSNGGCGPGNGGVNADRIGGGANDGNRSSISSEGFCENDTDMPDIPQAVLERRERIVNMTGDIELQVIKIFTTDSFGYLNDLFF